MLSALGLIACLACPSAVLPHAVAVDVELVLAVDASSSIDGKEFVLQREGYVAALRHPDFIRAVQAGRHGRIAITYFEWGRTPRPASWVRWTVIDGPDSAAAFARQVLSRPLYRAGGTSISAAITHGSLLFLNAFEGDRKVIDVSGDGVNSTGDPVEEARDRAVRDGVVINGLPIMIRPSPAYPEIDRYYAACVMGGPGSFSLPIRSPSEISTAIRRKLILEVSGLTPGPVVVVAAAAPVNCLIGEEKRRNSVDPFFQKLDR
jgi:hypothetical protein